jgi:transposase
MTKRASYPSDLTDQEWFYLEKLVEPHKSGGRPPKYSRREIMNGIFYLVRSGCAWRMIPNDLPHWKTCYHYFRLWSKERLWQKIHDQVRDWTRVQSGKKKTQALRSSTLKVLKQLINPDYVAMMLERKPLEEKGIYSWTRLD